MKPSQTPIYRTAERLLQWSITFAATLPKSLPYQVYGAAALQDIKQSLELIATAVTADRGDAQTRIQCLDAVGVKVAQLKSTMRIFSEVRTVSAPILSRRQYGQFIELANSLAMQAGAWRAKTAQSRTNDQGYGCN